MSFIFDLLPEVFVSHELFRITIPQGKIGREFRNFEVDTELAYNIVDSESWVNAGAHSCALSCCDMIGGYKPRGLGPNAIGVQGRRCGARSTS